jgi:hypothetical protein
LKKNNVAEVILPDLNLKTETVLNLFKDVDYDLRQVRSNKLVKPIYFTQFPKDLDELQSVRLKKETFYQDCFTINCCRKMKRFFLIEKN